MGLLDIPNVLIPGKRVKTDRINELLEDEECEKITTLFWYKIAL